MLETPDITQCYANATSLVICLFIHFFGASKAPGDKNTLVPPFHWCPWTPVSTLHEPAELQTSDFKPSADGCLARTNTSKGQPLPALCTALHCPHTLHIFTAT